jgi:hypothetical protein
VSLSAPDDRFTAAAAPAGSAKPLAEGLASVEFGGGAATGPAGDPVEASGLSTVDSPAGTESAAAW